MKKELHMKPLIFICTIFILIVLVFFIYPYKAGLMFNFKRIAYSDQRLVNEYFNLKITNKSYIKKCSIETDSNFLDYYMDVKLNIPVEDLDKTFSYYKNMQRITDVHGWFGSQLFTDWGINIGNFDYEYDWFEDARREELIGFGGKLTQRSPIIIFTKPVNGKVSVYMSEDKLGWD